MSCAGALVALPLDRPDGAGVAEGVAVAGAEAWVAKKMRESARGVASDDAPPTAGDSESEGDGAQASEPSSTPHVDDKGTKESAPIPDTKEGEAVVSDAAP